MSSQLCHFLWAPAVCGPHVRPRCVTALKLLASLAILALSSQTQRENNQLRLRTCCSSLLYTAKQCVQYVHSHNLPHSQTVTLRLFLSKIFVAIQSEMFPVKFVLLIREFYWRLVMSTVHMYSLKLLHCTAAGCCIYLQCVLLTLVSIIGQIRHAALLYKDVLKQHITAKKDDL